MLSRRLLFHRGHIAYPDGVGFRNAAAHRREIHKGQRPPLRRIELAVALKIRELQVHVEDLFAAGRVVLLGHKI